MQKKKPETPQFTAKHGFTASDSGSGGAWSAPATESPESWQRPDSGIEHEVQRYLQAESEIDASTIDVEVEGGKTILRGMVHDPRQIEIAEATARSAWGVKEVENRLRLTIAGADTDDVIEALSAQPRKTSEFA